MGFSGNSEVNQFRNVQQLSATCHNQEFSNIFLDGFFKKGISWICEEKKTYLNSHLIDKRAGRK